jgi:hypothetical protein
MAQHSYILSPTPQPAARSPRDLFCDRGFGKKENNMNTPDFPKEAQAPLGALNVLLILTDDVELQRRST